MPKTDPLAEAVSSVQLDDALKNRIHRLIDLTLTSAEQDLRTGTPQVRQAVMRIIVPAAMKNMNTESGDDLSDIRAAMAELQAGFQESVRSKVDAPLEQVEQVEDGSGIPVDGPGKVGVIRPLKAVGDMSAPVAPLTRMDP